MKIKIMAFFLSYSFLAPICASASTETEPKMFVMCKLGSIVRSIQVNQVPGGFETLYTKNGDSKSIGTGKNYESCVGFLNNVKTNLEKSGWTCKEVTDVSVTKESDSE